MNRFTCVIYEKIVMQYTTSLPGYAQTQRIGSIRIRDCARPCRSGQGELATWMCSTDILISGEDGRQLGEAVGHDRVPRPVATLLAFEDASIDEHLEVVRDGGL